MWLVDTKVYILAICEFIMEKAIAVLLIVLAVLVIVGAVMSESNDDQDMASGKVQLEVQDSAKNNPEGNGEVTFEVVGDDKNE